MKKKITVQRYQKSDFSRWNSFVNEAKNSTFLFHRDFMEYHADRFEDFSLILLDENQNITAIFPANKVQDTLYSHQGLTYGGLVLLVQTHLTEVVHLMHALLIFLNENGIHYLKLKVIPVIYNTVPADEMEYIAFILKAKLDRRDALAVVDLNNKIPVSRIRKRGVDKGAQLNLAIKEVTDFTDFWNQLLIPNLQERFGVKPVHTLEEITLLKSKFQDQIKQFNVYFEDRIIGGVTVFITENAIHPQYISGNKEFNNQYGGLDYLYHFLLNQEWDVQPRYFDFGPSNENHGLSLNESLHYWKESFGARTIVQNFYEIETKNYSLLEQVLI